MKKLAIGCLVVLVVLGVAGGLASYYVYRVVRDKVGDSIETFAALSKAPELERQVKNTRPFTSASDVLTPAQVERLVTVQTAVRTQLGAGFARMERQYKTLLEKDEATALDIPELISAYKDLASLWLAGKKAQVDALNAQGFSLSEYRWVRDRAYRAVGVPLMNVDISEMIEKGMRGENVEEQKPHLEGSIGPTGPAENQRIVERFKKALEENAALAIFGL